MMNILVFSAAAFGSLLVPDLSKYEYMVAAL